MQILVSSIIDILIAFIGSADFYNSLLIVPAVFSLFVNVTRLFKLVTASI